MSKTNLTPPEPQAQSDDNIGDVLQASTTVAGLAVALVAFLPNSSLGKLIIVKVGSLGLSLNAALLLCGTFALVASLWTLDGIRREAGISLGSLLTPRSHLSFLFWALSIFVLVYIGIVTSLQ